MAAGDIRKEFDLFVVELTLKTNTGCSKGDVLHFDTDGYAPATQAGQEPYYVALESVAAPGAGLQAKVRALAKGVVEVAKDGAAIDEGAYVMPSATAGAVTAFAFVDVPATFADTDVENAVKRAHQVVGRALSKAAAADSTVVIQLGK